MRDEFYFPSKDGNTEIHTIEWKPEGEVKAVLQLSHGMVEYIKRYDEFAEFMCSHGYYVVGNDHLGHGKSVQSKSEYGFFNEKYGNACVIGDMHANIFTNINQLSYEKENLASIQMRCRLYGIPIRTTIYPVTSFKSVYMGKFCAK